MMQRINSETEFHRRISNTNTGRISMTVYIDYTSKKYTIVEPSQESIFFESTSIELAHAKIKLLKEAMKFIEKELNQDVNNKS